MNASDAGQKLPIGMYEVLAVGLGAVSLVRIRRRRQKEAAEREVAERARQAEEGNSGRPSGAGNA